MTLPEVAYLQDQIGRHLALFFEAPVQRLFDSRTVRFVPYADALAVREKAIVVPIDVPWKANPESPYKTSFNGTELTLWNRIDKPSSEGWQSLPNESTPIWYRHKTGTLLPAWNLFGNLFQLLTFREERAITRRDGHGRFVGAYSPRLAPKLLEVPAFNEAVAVLAAAMVGLHEKGEPNFNLEGLIKAPVIVLSHDCDILYGNDFWTQSIRSARVLQPLVRLRPPKISNLWWLIRSAATPGRFYFDNVTGMIDLESSFGYTSTFYLLNGTGGRFGARNGLAPLPKLIKAIPSEYDIGLHYNYDTFLDERRFGTQLEELQKIVDKPISAGRAHYLRFDSKKSFPFLKQFGIWVDESSGFSDLIGFRNGIAGCFQVFDPSDKRTLDIWEIPMTIMDAAIVRQYGDHALLVFKGLLQHLCRIGGALSILFHPGLFFNPEFPEMRGIYHKMLIECRQVGAVSKTAATLANEYCQVKTNGGQ